jgi:hypothetical protein
LLVATFWPAVSGLAQPEPEPTPDPKFIMRGKWHIDFNRQDGFLRLTRERERGQGMRGPDPNPIGLGNCLGLQRPSGSAKKPVSFKVHGDAGDFEFEGEANATEGDGRFVFTADDDFEGAPSTEQLYSMTLYDVSFEYIRNLRGIIGTTQKPTFDQLIAMRMHGVDGDFLFGLKGLGYANIPIQDAIQIRKNGMTLEDARKIKAARPGISIQELAREKPRAKK